MRVRPRIGLAGGFRRPIPGAAGDLVRVVDGPDALLLLSANATDSGFGSTWPPGSRVLLDLVADEWRLASEPAAAGAREPDAARLREPDRARGRELIDSRLRRAVARGQGEFVRRAAALVGMDADSTDDPPSGTVTAVATDGERVWAEWIGADVAYVFRAGETLWRTRAHSPREDLLAQGESERDAARLATMATRFIHAGAPLPVAADRLSPPDHLLSGDRLVLVSATVLAVTSTALIWSIVGRARSPQRAADELVDLALRSDVHYAGAIIVELTADS